jgi:hypothetical protein
MKILLLLIIFFQSKLLRKRIQLKLFYILFSVQPDYNDYF